MTADQTIVEALLRLDRTTIRGHITEWRLVTGEPLTRVELDALHAATDDDFTAITAVWEAGDAIAQADAGA